MDVASYKPGCVSCTTRFITSRPSIYGQGFTLVELLVAMAILAILSATVFPAFKTFISSQRKITSLNSLSISLYLARSEAIMRSSDVMVCKSSNGVSCITSGEWDQGWIVFEDRDRDRNHDSDEPVISRQQTIPGTTVYYRAFGSNNYIVYNSRGVTNTNGTYTFCDSDGAGTPRALIVYKTGRARASLTSSDGSPLTCPP